MDAESRSPSLQHLIHKAESDLFPSVSVAQRARLAEAWANFRRSAAALAESNHGELPSERVEEALACARAGIQALLALAGARRAAEGV